MYVYAFLYECSLILTFLFNRNIMFRQAYEILNFVNLYILYPIYYKLDVLKGRRGEDRFVNLP